MDISERLKSLPGMSKIGLSRLWEELFNKPVPERIRKELMVRISDSGTSLRSAQFQNPPPP